MTSSTTRPAAPGAASDGLMPLLARLADPATRADPYPLYAAFRSAGAGLVGGQPVAFVSRYDEVAALLRDPRLSSSPDVPGEEPADGVRRAFLFLDPPDHTRLRRLVSSAFTPRVVEGMRAQVLALTDELIDALPADGGEFDLVEALAHPLPVRVICRLLGVPTDDAERLRRWMLVMSEGLDPLVASMPDTPRQAAARDEAAAQLRAHLAEVVAQRRAEPRDDLVSALLAVRDAGDSLTDAELLSTCGLLLLAGNITTVNLIAHAVLTVLRVPAELAALRRDPGRAAPVVEELLRYEPPAHLVTRTALADVEVGDVVVPRGHRIVLLLAAANRDPARFTDPERFDPDRPDARRHLAFGAGAHFCLGAPLARLETETALVRLVQRAEGLRLVTDPPPYKPNVTMRGPAQVRVHVDAVRPAAP
jgi:cytochrome P450